MGSLEFKEKYNKNHSNFDPGRFRSCAAYEFHNKVLTKRHLCASHIVNLDSLAAKGIDFLTLLDHMGWTPLLSIQKLVYPDLVREFYANIQFHEGVVHSYVKKVHIHLTRENVSAALHYFDVGPRCYMSGKWDASVGITSQVALTQVCENFSGLDGTNLTHKALGPTRTLLHRIITHILMPQSDSFQRVTVCDTLVLFAILTSSRISFAYLMVRHMWDYVRSDKKANLPYGIFLTCLFEFFRVDLANEKVENKVSVIKGGGVTGLAKTNKGKRPMTAASSESDQESRPAKPRKANETLRDILIEFSNMSKIMEQSFKTARKQAFENEKGWSKCKERVNLMLKNLEKDMGGDDEEHKFESEYNLSDD